MNVHARGHGLQSLGMVDQDELQKKRTKTLEHQLAIKEQVEEKRRLKQEEKERRMKEEAEKEKELAQERARLQVQYEEELKMRREKEEESRRQAEALQLSVLQAHESAQLEKAAKRIKHLESGGHDVSGLKSSGRQSTTMQTNRSSYEIQDHQPSPRIGQADQSSPRIGQADQSSPRIGQDDQSSPRIGQADQSSPRIGKDHQSSPRIEKHLELLKTDDRISSSTRQNNEFLESELKEISLNTSLESEWTPSPSVSTLRNDSQAKLHLESSPPPRKFTGQKNKTTRAQSERSQRKKQLPGHQNNKRTSSGNITQGLDVHPAPPLEDAFMLPYRRTSSATFRVGLDTPSSRQDTRETTSKRTLKNVQPSAVPPTNQAAESRQVTTKRTTTISKDIARAKGGQRVSSKNNSVSRLPENRGVKKDKSNNGDGKPVLHPVQVSHATRSRR